MKSLIYSYLIVEYEKSQNRKKDLEDYDKMIEQQRSVN